MEDDSPETVLPLPFWIAVLVIIFCWPSAVFSQPIFTMKAQDGPLITLFDEKCGLDGVTNLPYRATWVEKGQTFEGCWMPRPDMGVVVGFFSDKTAVAMPIRGFERVVGI
jgi:hypothetical protein